MSELDQLRELMDEAGVGYLNRSSDVTIGYYTNPHTVTEAMDGSLQMTSLTAGQVMRALERCNVGRYVGLRQGKYWERTENSDYYCGGCGWEVTDHDSYCPECGGALHKSALEPNTTTVDETETWQGVCMSKPIRYVSNLTIHVMECSACGHTYEHVNGSYEYCPHCGRRIVEVDDG